MWHHFTGISQALSLLACTSIFLAHQKHFFQLLWLMRRWNCFSLSSQIHLCFQVIFTCLLEFTWTLTLLIKFSPITPWGQKLKVTHAVTSFSCFKTRSKSSQYFSQFSHDFFFHHLASPQCPGSPLSKAYIWVALSPRKHRKHLLQTAHLVCFTL